MDSKVPAIPPLLNNPEETEEMKRLRELVEKGLGASNFELVGIRDDGEGNMLSVFRKRTL
jgi:hypothetical protein